MPRTTRIVVSTLAIAALGIAGSQSGASATQGTDTCTHGVLVPSSGHNAGVEYLSSRDVEDAHIHKYKHHVAFPGFPHNRERNC
jgi:hypothetical protein